MTGPASTIGVAIAVPDPWGRRLQDYRADLGDDTADGIPTHITLVPPMRVADAQLDTVTDHLARVGRGVATFRVLLRGTGSFRPTSPVVFVTLAEGISGCEALAEAVRSGPLHCELAFPYHPHVTIAHDRDEPTLDRAFAEMSDFECGFTVTGFELYAHEANEGWRPRRQFGLVPAGDA